MKTWILAFLVLFVAQSANAATYWVSKSASGQHCVNSATDPGPGSSSLTINQALGCVSNAQGAGAGSSIVVKAGTYVEGILRNSSNPPPSGTSWNAPFTIRANTGETVVLKNSSGMNVNVSASFGDLYFVMQGFTFDGTNLDSGTAQVFLGDGAPSAPNHVKIMDSFFINNAFVNAILTAGSDTQFINNKVHGGGFADNTANSNVGYHIPIYVQSSNSLISGNEVYDYPGWGMQIYNGLGTNNDNNVVTGNWFHTGGWGSVAPGRIPARVAILSYGGNNSKIYNNIVSDSTGKCYGLGPGASPLLYNNVCYNMTADTSGDNIGGTDAGPSTASIKNNIFTNLHGQAVFSTTPNGNATNNFCDALSTGCTITGSIGFANAPNGDFHLTAGSPAVSAGANVSSALGCISGTTCVDYAGTPRPQGAGWDVGAYEFTGANLPVLAINAISPAAPATCDPAFSACTIVGSANNIIQLSGTSTQNGGTVAWSCNRCGSGSTTGTLANWTTTNITLKSGINVITITGTDGTGNVGTTQISVTFVPTFPGNTAVLLLGFENGSGTSATDSSGNSNTGTLTNGVTWVPNGRFGKAVSFDGINDFVNVADANSLHLTQSWTISAYVQPVTSFTTFKAVVHKNATPTDPQGSGYELYGSIAATGGCTAGGVGAFVNVNGTSGPDYGVCTSTPLQTNVWTHLAATYDNAAGQLKLYRDGALIQTTSATGYIEPSTGSLQIGASEFGEQFQGLIDEVRVYNFALPQAGALNSVANNGAACTQAMFNENNAVGTASIIGNRNCPIINLNPPSQFKVSSGSTQMKFGPSATAAKIGANP